MYDEWYHDLMNEKIELLIANVLMKCKAHHDREKIDTTELLIFYKKKKKSNETENWKLNLILYY